MAAASSGATRGGPHPTGVHTNPFGRYQALDDWYQVFPEAENLQLDLREKDACYEAVRDARFVFNLAADMGGMGFIETQQGRCACCPC